MTAKILPSLLILFLIDTALATPPTMVPVFQKPGSENGETTNKRIFLQLRDLMREGVPDQDRFFEVTLKILEPGKGETMELYLMDANDHLVLIAPITFSNRDNQSSYQFRIQKHFLKRSFVRIKFSDGKYYRTLLDPQMRLEKN